MKVNAKAEVKRARSGYISALAPLFQSLAHLRTQQLPSLNAEHFGERFNVIKGRVPVRTCVAGNGRASQAQTH